MAAQLQRQFQVGGGGDAGCKGQPDLFRRFDNTGIRAGCHTKCGSRVIYLPDLVRMQDRADASQHFRNFPANGDQRLHRRRSPQRQFHGVDASVEQRSCQRNRVLGLVDDQHGHDATSSESGDNLSLEIGNASRHLWKLSVAVP